MTRGSILKLPCSQNLSRLTQTTWYSTVPLVTSRGSNSYILLTLPAISPISICDRGAVTVEAVRAHMTSDCVNADIYMALKDKHDANRRHRTDDEIAKRSIRAPKTASGSGGAAGVVSEPKKGTKAGPSKPFDRIDSGQRESHANDLVKEALSLSITTTGLSRFRQLSNLTWTLS